MPITAKNNHEPINQYFVENKCREYKKQLRDKNNDFNALKESINTINNSSLFVSNYYKSINNNYYSTGTKYIISIASGTGDFATKTGYVVIDALENKRLVTIGLHKD